MKILLKFDAELLALWGEDFGKEIWTTQIEPYSDQEHLTLVFPEQNFMRRYFFWSWTSK